MNMLKNPGFEGGWTRRTHTGQEYGEIVVPDGWTAYWREDKSVPHDPANPNGYGRPEMHVINREVPFLDPLRILSGERSLKFFTFFRIHDAGVYQVVDGFTPGQRVMATGWAHGWSSAQDDARCSDGAHVGCGPVVLEEGAPGLDDGDRNMTFRIGIDPAGGTDPWAESVIWGPGRHIYNAYAQIPELEVVAEAEVVTVFVRSSVLWPFKHCDAYVDDMQLEVVGQAEEPASEGAAEPTNYAYPIVETGSKLHPHAVGEGGTYDLLTFLAEHDVELPFLKVVACKPHDLPAVRNLKHLSPGTHIIARVILGDDGFNPQGWGPTLDAEAYMAQVVAWAKAYPEAEYWSLWNEEDPPDHVPMARFAIECMDIAEREGFRLVLMDYSTGVPENADWQAIWDKTQFFQRAKAGGHILGLHAYCRTANAEETAAHLLRPRWLYETILIPNDCVVPFVFTEESIDETAPGVGISDWSVADLMAEYQRADALLAEMWYCLGASVYTFGQLPDYMHNKIWRNVAEIIVAARDRQNALPPATRPEVHSYDRVVIIADPTYMDAEQIAEAYRRGHEELRTVTPSWNDAVLPFMVRPEEWETNTVDAGPLPLEEREKYEDWVRDRDPGTVLVFDELPGPPPVGEFAIVDVRAEMPTNPESPWYPWKRRDLEEIDTVFVHHSAGAASNYLGTVMAIATYHTRATGKNRPGICYAYVIGSDGTVWQTADVEDVVFSQGSIEHPGDENRFGVGVCLLGCFIDGQEPTVEQVESLIQLIGMISRMVGRPLRVWGHKDVAATQCPGDSWPWREGWGRTVEPEPRGPVLLGFNDYPGETGTGCGWLMENGAGGLIVQPAFIGGTAGAFDADAAASGGVRVIVNLRYSWSTDCGGAGTLPAPGSPQWQLFIDAAIQTIERSTGVWGWTISNEANNPREFPRGASLTAGDVVAAYNAIRARVPAGIRMAPGALDPFNAQAGDPRDWLREIYEGIDGAEFVAFHGYVRGPDPELVGSTAKFADAPLTWQYLNYPGCVTALAEALPAGYRDRPWYMTELNHLWRTVEGDWGWVDDERAAEVVRRAHIAAEWMGFAGLALYRWAGDAWTIERNGTVLEVVRELLG